MRPRKIESIQEQLENRQREQLEKFERSKIAHGKIAAPDNMIVAIFSMGQFISSNVKKLQNGFDVYYAMQGVYPPGEDLWNWILQNLTPLRTGEMSLEDFHKKFDNYVYGMHYVKIPFEKFKEIFNSMSKVDESTLARIIEFKKFLENRDDIQLLLVSHTNYSHLDYVLSQIQHALPKFGIVDIKNSWDNDAKILFVPSMSSKCPEHSGTLKYALDKLQLNPETKLVSFLNTIKTFDCPPYHYSFKYVDAGTVLNLDIVRNHLEENELELENTSKKMGFSGF